MAFDPAEFLETAKSVLADGQCERDFRTVAGRAYYAAYGTMRTRLSRAKGIHPDQLFGKAGRHSDIVRAISLSSPALRKIGAHYLRLYSERVKSDYKYDTEVRRGDAEMALQAASWIVSSLNSLRDRDFRSAPFAPR